MRGATLAIAALLAVAIAAPGRAAERSLQEIQECVRGNLPERTVRQDLSLLARDAAGAEQSLEAALFWKRGDDDRSRVLVRIEAPPDLRGTAFLFIERERDADMFSYLPELRRVRRITGRMVSGSLFGTDFSYEDVVRLHSLAAQTGAEKRADARVAERAVWVLTAPIPPESGSQYERVVTFVDQETCVPLKTELLDGSEQVRKEVVIPPEQVKAEGARFVPREILARDLEEGSETRMRVEKLELDVPLSDSFFTEAALLKRR